VHNKPLMMTAYGENVSAIPFAYNRGWETIVRDPVVARLLNNTTGNTHEINFKNMQYLGSQFLPDNPANERFK